MNEPTVKLRRQWNDHRIATYRVADLRGLHWSEVSGGLGTRAPREFLSGYVLCDEMVAGELSHSCRHGRPPHQIKVCVTKKDNSKAVYAYLLRRWEWEYMLGACPFLVDAPTPTPPSPAQAAAMAQWLDEHWRAGGYLTLGFGRDADASLPAARPQVWLSNPEIAKAFAAAFRLQPRGHQNQEKRHRAAMQLAAADLPSPLGAGPDDGSSPAQRSPSVTKEPGRPS